MDKIIKDMTSVRAMRMQINVHNNSGIGHVCVTVSDYGGRSITTPYDRHIVSVEQAVEKALDLWSRVYPTL